MLSPEDITSRSFLVSLRGYDRDEVHAFLAQVADGVRDLTERIEELESQPPPPGEAAPAPSAPEAAAAAVAPSSASELFAQIGQETQRILEAAQAAGDDLRRKAEEEASELRRVAKEETDALRETTEAETAELRRTAEEETAELRASTETEVATLRQEAETEVAELRRVAKEETDALRETTEAEAAELRRTTKEATDREIKSARAEATKIIAEGERRREAIEAVAVGLTEARDELAGQLRELGRSVERTLREFTEETASTATMREAVAASVAEDAGVAAEVAEEPGEAGAEAAEEPGGAGADVAEEPGEAGGEAAEEPGEAAAEAAEEPGEAAAEPAEEPGDAAGATAEEPGEAPAADVADADADAEVAVAVAAAAVTAEGTDVTDELETLGAAGLGPAPTPELLEEAQALRASALAPLHPKLVRKLKRGLQDLQNGILDRLRRADAKGEADAFLPDYTAISTLSALSEEFLVTAWWAGTASGELLAGEEVEAPEPEDGLAGELTSGIADQLMAELASGLAEGLGAGEDIVALGERIGAIFGAVKEAPVEELAALALLRTYEEGLHAAWVAGEATHRHWALATEPPCEDGRCADNHRSGPAPLGAPFASGHMNPPVRVGCNCTTVPAPL